MLILSAAPSQVEIDEILDGIYAKKPNVIGELLRRFFDWLRDLLASMNFDGHISSFSPAQMVILILATALVVSVIVILSFVLFRRIGRRSRSVSMPDGERITEFTITEAVAAFHSARASGDFRRAVIWLFSAYLHSLAAKNLVTLHDSRTNRQYRSQLSSAGYANLDFFDRFARVFAELRFGGYDADEAMCDFWADAAAPFLREVGEDV